jgi:predicted RNA binding protein YcfA (HicA-like mRNA interferase family)
VSRYRKDVGEVIKYAQCRGFECLGMTGSGHWKLKHPTGGLLILPATPSGSRWVKNVHSDIRRILKEKS